MPRLLEIATLDAPLSKASPAPSSMPSNDQSPQRPVVMPTLVPDVPISRRASALDLAIPLIKTRELSQFYKNSIDVGAWRIERELSQAAE